MERDGGSKELVHSIKESTVVRGPRQDISRSGGTKVGVECSD